MLPLGAEQSPSAGESKPTNQPNSMAPDQQHCSRLETRQERGGPGLAQTCLFTRPGHPSAHGGWEACSKGQGFRRAELLLVSDPQGPGSGHEVRGCSHRQATAAPSLAHPPPQLAWMSPGLGPGITPFSQRARAPGLPEDSSYMDLWTRALGST